MADVSVVAENEYILFFLLQKKATVPGKATGRKVKRTKH